MVKEPLSLWQAARSQGYSRRDFLKFCGWLSAAAVALELFDDADADAFVAQEDIPQSEDDGPFRLPGEGGVRHMPDGGAAVGPGCSSMYWM